MPINPVLAVDVAIIGAGPAGLMAAEVLSAAGVAVHVFDAMPSVGRKFLLAGKGGLNITHSEAFEAFAGRYGSRRAQIEPMLQAFGPDALRAWVEGLGVSTFVGSSGRVFPAEMKAAPLLRAWLARLRGAGVRFHPRHRWTGWGADGRLQLATPDGPIVHTADATLLALGGGSWQRLGSDGAWVPLLAGRAVDISPLRPANSGFEVAGWSEHLRGKFAGAPLKNVTLALDGEAPRRGEFVLTEHGIEGSLVYALSAAIRQRLEQHGSAQVYLDLQPERSQEKVTALLSKPRGSASMAKHLHRQLSLDGAKAALLRELTTPADFADMSRLARAIKALPIEVNATRPIEEAISSAGGVALAELDTQLMLTQLPGVFCAGEMLDWEAPTGGYLLTGCFSTGYQAARGIAAWLQSRP